MKSNRLEEIDSLGKVIADSSHFGEHNDENMLAQDIFDAGYGNVKQAVKEFAEKLKASFYNMDYSAIAIDNKIDNLITELYGADE